MSVCPQASLYFTDLRNPCILRLPSILHAYIVLKAPCLQYPYVPRFPSHLKTYNVPVSSGIVVFYKPTLSPCPQASLYFTDLQYPCVLRLPSIFHTYTVLIPSCLYFKDLQCPYVPKLPCHLKTYSVPVSSGFLVFYRSTVPLCP